MNLELTEIEIVLIKKLLKKEKDHVTKGTDIIKIQMLQYKLNNLTIPVVGVRSEQLKDKYKQTFLDWMEKYFVYEPRTYEYKSKHNRTMHTLGMLRKDYKRAMLEDPFN